VVDTFAVAQSSENLVLFPAQFGRNDDGDWLVDGLFGREPKEALRPCVPGPNDAIEIL
jgi:hypothetical protein